MDNDYGFDISDLFLIMFLIYLRINDEFSSYESKAGNIKLNLFSIQIIDNVSNI